MLGSLIGELRGQTRARVNFAAVGPREQAQMIGTLGACGRENCSSTHLQDFAPVSNAAVLPMVVVTSPETRIGSMQDLLARAKAKPGEITYGTPGQAGSAHLAGAMLENLSGTKMTNVPFKGNAPALAEVMAGRVTFMFYPIIGIANTWIETMPCNYGLRRLAEAVKEGVRAAGGTPMEFNTVSISDGVTMGTEGMKTSLISREVIADSVELVGRGHMFDGIVALGACDKTLPGLSMALARLNVPSFLLYGGTIMPGYWRGTEVTIQTVYEAIGANAAGKMSDEDLRDALGRLDSDRRRSRAGIGHRRARPLRPST